MFQIQTIVVSNEVSLTRLSPWQGWMEGWLQLGLSSSILVLTNCVINYAKISGLKEQKQLSYVLWIRNAGYSAGSSGLRSLISCWGCSQLKSWLGRINFKTNSHSCWKVLCPCWLLARDVSSLSHGAFHRFSHSIEFCIPHIKESKGGQARQKA
jgi:hypothetical protein